jgi:hypothetical protein
MWRRIHKFLPNFYANTKAFEEDKLSDSEVLGQVCLLPFCWHRPAVERSRLYYPTRDINVLKITLWQTDKWKISIRQISLAPVPGCGLSRDAAPVSSWWFWMSCTVTNIFSIDPLVANILQVYVGLTMELLASNSPSVPRMTFFSGGRACI